MQLGALYKIKHNFFLNTTLQNYGMLQKNMMFKTQENLAKKTDENHLFNVIIAVYPISKCLTQIISKCCHIIVSVSEVVIIAIPPTIM